MRGLKGAMNIILLKQGLKHFWDNCKLVVLSHIRKYCTFLQMLVWGRLFKNFQLTVEGWVFKISEYWNRTTALILFLQAIIITTSVTLFFHILRRDSHSITITPRTITSLTFSLLLIQNLTWPWESLYKLKQINVFILVPNIWSNTWLQPSPTPANPQRRHQK